MDRILTIVPSIRSRRMTAAASWMRKNGARRLTAIMRSNRSGVVSEMVPRSVIPAALTNMSIRPKARSAAAMTARAWPRSPRSARTNSPRQPARSRSAATALPRAMLRPQIAMPAAPRAANRRAIASPIPCVPPVTTAILLLSSAPSRCASTMSNPRTVRPYSGEAESQYGCPLHFRPVICAQGFARMQGEIETMRVGLLGAGRIGRIHAGNIAAHKRAKLVAVADPDIASAQAVADATGAAVETADAILAAPDIDAIFICTPTDMHAQLIEGAVRANKAVFCEKPIDLDAARIRACLDVVRNAGTRLMVGFNRRFDPS